MGLDVSVICADSWLHFHPLTVSEKKYPVLHGLKEQQNINVLRQELEKCK